MNSVPNFIFCTAYRQIPSSELPDPCWQRQYPGCGSERCSLIQGMTGSSVKEAYCDRGYRGHICTGDTDVHIVGKKNGLSRSLRKWLRRRCAIEPIIGHMKSDNRMDRNYLKGKEGDKINALLCGCGANIRKLIKAFFLSFGEFIKIHEKMLQYIKMTGIMKILSWQFNS